MGFLRKLCPCFNPKPSSFPPSHSSLRIIKRERRSNARTTTSPHVDAAAPLPPRHISRSRRHRRSHRSRRVPVSSGYHVLPSYPIPDPNVSSGPIPSSRFIPPQDGGAPSPAHSPQNRHTLRHRISEAFIQEYEPGGFGPPVVTTGPPLQEEWINNGKKKFTYSNADVIWRANDRRVHWGGSQANTQDTTDNGQDSHFGSPRSRPGFLDPRNSPQMPPAPLLRTVPLPDPDTDFMHHFQNPQPSPVVHPLLRTSSPYESLPYLLWDILRPPRTIHAYHAISRTPRLDPNFDASIPPLHRLRITLSTPNMKFWMQRWGVIRVIASAHLYVTLGDILQAIYDYFHTSLTQEDFTVISNGPWRGVLEQARMKRYLVEQSVVGSAVERNYVRADLLNGNTLFGGLRWNREIRRVDCWELVLRHNI
ncbi:hypothetical protein C8R42DRAFT_717002 [Lentinula raphanica]|nr:hypothetical protein C8R42DRAFT_717002 [Lentinula raphanica]